MQWSSRSSWSVAARRGKAFLAAALLACLVVQGLGVSSPEARDAAGLSLRTSAFAAGGPIPQRFTCDGAGVSPPLSWSGVPREARSLVLLVEDPDAPDPRAPRTIWTHWLLYDLPPAATRLPENVKPSELPAGTRQGLNGWRREGYGGPCPPIGTHRYFFRLLALDTTLAKLPRPTREAILDAVRGHVIARAELMGTYRRSR